ncbi:MAG TPA: hypothetical protein VEZ40_16635 [Pyrinomonadaceae bacterium]|nr:hypothetical protein [Pyrinomonadaceae bacterium]
MDDTKSGAGEPAAKAQEGGGGGDERAAARPGAPFEPGDAATAPFESGDAAAAPHAAATNSPAPDPAAGEFALPAPGAASGRQPAPHIEPLMLQPEFRAGDKSQYHVAELLAYHDRHFVESVYRAILGRTPFPAEGARALDELRGGRASKVEIIERLLSSPEARAAGRGVSVEGLPSPASRRLSRVPFVGYVLRLVRALWRLPLLIEHQQQFEAYALAQQQLIADYLNRTLAQMPHASAAAPDAPVSHGAPTPSVTLSQHEEMVETLVMFSDALIEVSNGHAELQAQTQTQAEQAQAALAELTEALTAQQQLAETFRREQELAFAALRREQQLAADALRQAQQLTGDTLRHAQQLTGDTLQREQQLLADALRREQQLLADALRHEQQLAADAQQEFLIHEQRVIVETQQVVLEALREELGALSERQQRARDEFEAEVNRLRSLQESASAAARENFSGHT